MQAKRPVPYAWAPTKGGRKMARGLGEQAHIVFVEEVGSNSSELSSPLSTPDRDQPGTHLLMCREVTSTQRLIL